MARSAKQGIRYFSVDVDIFSDRKVRRVIAACGAAAMGVVLRVLCDIYGEQGYYLTADDDYYFDAADALGVDEAFVREVVRRCVDTGFFDAGMQQRYGILTSRRVQRNFLDATYKRVHHNTILPAYLLLEDDASEPSDGNGESDIRNSESDIRDSKSDIQSTQIKLNKIKPEERKEDQTKPEKAGGGESLSFGPFVSMKGDEYAALCSEYGEAGAKRMTEMLGDYKAASGKRYESDYHAIRSWVVKRWQEERGSPPRQGYERPVGSYDHLATDPFSTKPTTGKYSEII